MPGHAGAPSPTDYSHEAHGQIAAELAVEKGPDVVVGFSMGANVALERAEKGDGGLTAAERHTVENCSTVKIVTIPGNVFFLPNEAPDQIAAVVNEAVGRHASRREGGVPRSYGAYVSRVRSVGRHLPSLGRTPHSSVLSGPAMGSPVRHVLGVG
jgi:surfactin synthase thioesterase subunit